MSLRRISLLLFLAIFATACLPTPVPGTPAITPTQAPSDTPTPVETATSTATTTLENTSTPEITPSVTTIPPTPELPEEAILILEPGPGSRVTSPVRVAGVSNPTFEQALTIRVLLDDGTELTTLPITIQAEAGQRGNFEAEVPVSLTEERPIFIQVYDTSARDGGILHLSSVVVTFTPTGPQALTTQEPHPEQIAIFQPQTTQTISGGLAHVEGFGLATFEQALLVEVQDADGNVVGSQPITTQAPDVGIPGPFSADVPYTVSAAGPGRVVVRDISPAHGDNTHLSSVEVTLEP